MKITDDILSAFLDAELPETEMEALRARIAVDESLANRLAELAAVDTHVRNCYSRIDQTPVPEAVLQRLQSHAQQTNATAAEPASSRNARILRFPVVVRQRMALAASIAFALGFGLNHWLATPSGGADDWQQVASALESAPSGTTVATPAGTALTPRITFTNARGQFCRQYQVRDAGSETLAVACRSAGQWHQVVALTTVSDGDMHAVDHYQTATGDNPINAMVETMAVGNFLGRTEEANAIADRWQTSSTNNSSGK